MEIKKQNIHMNYEKASAMSQITLDDDYNLPDYRPDIVKVLKEKGEIRFDEIQVKEGRIYVKGNLIFYVLYRSDMEEHKLDCLRGQIPFEETISMDGVNELDPVDVTAELEDINIGIINSRKLSVRALVMLKAEMRMRKETELITGVAMEHPLEILQNRHNILELETCKKDNYRLKQEIELPQSKPDVEQILWKSVQLRGVETRLREEKIQLTGEIRLFLLYYAQKEERRLEWLEETIPLNGELACEGCSEEKIYRIQVTPASMEVEVRPDYDGEDRKISLDMTLELDICIWKETEADVVEDVYSLREEMTPAYEDVTMSRLLAKNYAKCRLTDHMNLKKNQENILQICSCEGMAFIDHVEPQADGLKVEGSLNVEILYVTTDDAMPIGTCRETFPFEQLIEVPEMTDNMNYELEAGIEQLSAILLDNTQIEVKAVLNLNLIAFSQENIQKMDEIRITERDMEELQRQPGITGYIVREGDSLWKIAKANHTTISQLMETNDLKSEEIQKGDKLLIVKMVS